MPADGRKGEEAPPVWWTIDPAIARAATLPAEVYSDPRWLDAAREKVFARTWHLIGDADQLLEPGQCLPVTLLPGFLDEPLLLTRGRDGGTHLLSNVCTHRGALLCGEAAIQPGLRCRYHGRRFGLDGRFLSMPEFEGAEGFPSLADDLPRVAFASLGKLIFASLAPAFPFEELVAEMTARVGWLPIGEALLDPSRSRDYDVPANWAVYCDNYLEGLHIPFVHAALLGALDFGAYRTEVYRWASLQVGAASGDDAPFDLPPSSPDHGRRIAAYYWWLFPATMINVYPWGLSVNLVQPLAPDRTRVAYRTYVWEPGLLGLGASADLDRVEREDEAVVESVQKGVRSRLYRRGRYSPKHEAGVHHFHRLLTCFLSPE
jgi:choline monooxygenase